MIDRRGHLPVAGQRGIMAELLCLRGDLEPDGQRVRNSTGFAGVAVNLVAHANAIGVLPSPQSAKIPPRPCVPPTDEVGLVVEQMRGRLTARTRRNRPTAPYRPGTLRNSRLSPRPPAQQSHSHSPVPAVLAALPVGDGGGVFAVAVDLKFGVGFGAVGEGLQDVPAPDSGWVSR